MIKNSETPLERRSLPAEKSPTRKPYEPPSLREWGSLLDMTRGNLSDLSDANFNGGSGGV
jgi:hypothetical protein